MMTSVFFVALAFSTSTIVAQKSSATLWQMDRQSEQPPEPRGYNWQQQQRGGEEWSQQRQGYHANNAPSYDAYSQADCGGTVASKTCECTDGGKRVTCRSTTFYSLQNDLPCPRNIQYLTLISPHFGGSKCLTRDNMTSLPNLRQLIITGSDLEVVSREVFRGQPQLQVVDLRNNLRLETIDPDAFAGSPSLTCIDLSNNERIGNLPPTVFIKTNRLASLNLSAIGLSELPQLPGGGVLKILDISRNELVFLPADLVQTFSRLDKIYLADNPWCCSRPSRWLSMYIRIVGDRAVVRDRPICQGPNEVYGFPIKMVLPEQMDQFSHCKGYSGIDDSRSCKEIYGMFRNVIPQLPTNPDNQLAGCNNNRPQIDQNYQQQQGNQIADFETPQYRPQQPPFGKLNNNNQHRPWSRQTTTLEPQRALICLSSVGGDCTTGNIIVGTIATVVGAGIIAAIVGIVRFVQRRRSEAFRTPSVF